MEALYINQTEIEEGLRKLLVNFKKDSAERKTIDYCKRKLELLEAYWREFQINHEKLSPFETTHHQYFVNSEFQHTQELYLTAKRLINQCRDDLIQRSKQTASPQPLQQGATGPSTSQMQSPPTAVLGRTFESRGSNSKLDDMLHKQSVNFKAFTRAVDNIDIESIEDKWEFEDALRILQNRWTTIDNLHWEIIGESGEDSAYESYFSKHEQTFNSMKKAINSKMWSTSYREKSTPKIDIPVFTGNYHHWVSFKDLFSEAIHKNTALSNAQKMQFLKSKVKGEAERLIQHLPISADNYIVCWEILNHRFENKKLIFTSHMNVLFNLPNIQQQSFPAIKKLHDVTIESLHAIKNLGVDTSTWDPLLVHLLSQKLDTECYSEYIESLKNSRELPVLQDFLNFLENKFTTLESSRRRQDIIPKAQQSSQQNNPSTSFPNNRKSSYYKPNDSYYFKPTKSVTKSLHVGAIKCPLCLEEHNLANCEKFKALSDDLKLKTVKQYNYCINCIHNHNGYKCHSTKRCRKCTGYHHTILHECFPQQKLKSNYIKQEVNTSQNSINGAHASQREASEILLATALVKVTAADNTQHVMRALIDQGSQISLISEKAAQQLGLKRQQFSGVVFGVGEKESNCKGMMSIRCQSIYTDFNFSTEVVIMNNLLKNLPNRSFLKPTWSHLKNINLADPDFYTSRPVNVLLGADVYAIIMLDGMIRGSHPSSPLAQQTQLGWLLCGSIKTFHCNVVLNNLEDIRQFWEIEDIQEANELSAEDQECVKHYLSTTKRLESGRYEVSLPMKQQVYEKLGSSKEMALAQFRNLERKFSKQNYLAQQYRQFLSEYEKLGHMKLTTSCNNQLECFLPHHAVQRDESTTTKLRVVFNASAKTSSGHSLNDLMHKGPNLQQDLQKLLLNWRQYRYAYTADIAMMYRQISVRKEDQKFQKIFWRENPNQAISTYQLTTVTYGTKSAPFLAMMTLRQLATDEQHNFPRAANSLRQQFYMDDLASGAHSIMEGKQHIAELISCLSSGRFLLRKWSSNEKTLLENIDLSQQSKQPSFTFKNEISGKTLGLLWNPIDAIFTFEANLLPDTNKLTKRSLLSEISKIFDPLGWVAPLTTKMKLLFQKVWADSQTQWSDEVSTEIKDEWVKLKSDMKCICNFRIPRWLQSKRDDVIELHGFCDASPKAYACVVYARVVLANSTSVVLIAAKSRLVPSSRTVSLPRLELCAAELLSRLISKIVTSLDSMNHEIYGWSDSKVTLSWIQGNPDRWKPFVCNRVKKITAIMSPEKWYYVSTKQNPADAASRGLLPSQLMEHSLWWHGPSWLSTQGFEPKSKQFKYTTEEEIKKQTITVQNCSPENNIIGDLLTRHSSFIKVVRIVAWLLRARAPASKQRPAYITLHELRKAKSLIIKTVQRNEFTSDIDDLSQKKLSSSSKLLNLNPFLDQDGILRVGGRLRFANISSSMKYPMIIPYSGRLTELLINQAHELTFHGGTRLTLSLLRQSYWIIKGNRAVKKQLRNCVICKKQEPRRLHQIMGDLPDFRTNPAPPFYHTGVDYTGFIRVKANKGKDGLVRVVTLKTKNGYIKRPVIRLSVLPLDKHKESEVCKQKQKESKAQTDNSKQTYIRPSITSITLALLFFISIITSTNASYSFKTFDSNQTLYFDPWGTMYLIRDEWKIVTYYNMSPYWQGDKAVSEFTKYLEQTCEKIQKPSHCYMILLQIQHEFNELQYYNQLLLNQHFDTRLRTKRGLINAVGSIANSLFGVLDQEFADKYKQDIDLIHSNIIHLHQLYKNQTSIIEAEYNILKRVENTIEKQHKIINRHLNNLDNVTNKLQKEIDLVFTQQDFTLAAFAAMNMIQNLKRIQDNLIDTMTEIYHGQLNLHLMTPKQLQDQLLIISGQIPNELALPVDDIQSNLYRVYKLLKIKARVTEEYFFLEITLPLISRDIFQLYKLIPVPIQMNQKMISIKPSSDYVAINLKRDAYLSASDNELQGCEKQEDNYLCRLHGPIKHLSSDERFCETDTPPTCKSNKSSCKNVWIQLRDVSTYLYFCCDSYSLRVICDDVIQTRQVSKAGLVHLSKQCMIKGRDVTLYSYQELSNTVTLEPNILMTKLSPIQHLVNNITLPIQDFEDVEYEKTSINNSLKHLGDQIKSMKESVQQTDILSTHDIHHYALSYGLLAAGVAAALWFLWRRGRRAVSSSQQQRNVSVPSSVSVCVNQPIAEQSSSVSAQTPSPAAQGTSECDSVSKHSVAKRWSSIRLKKRDMSTSPIAKRQSVFAIDESAVGATRHI